ncbi:MAG: hypothetical protein IJQ40_04210 [Bacilli bacterium]|nr:hypothetical protein [Bacilli bacterium]
MKKETVAKEEVKTEETSSLEEQPKTEEIKEETPVPETPTEPVKPVYDSEELQAIEDERVKFLGEYRSGNRLKSIIFFIVMFLMVGTFIIIPNVGQGAAWQLPVMISIAVVLLGCVLGFSFLTRKKMTQKMRNYFSIFYGNMNKYVFGSKSFDKVVFENPGKIEDHLFLDSNLYKDVLEVRSRGATTFEYEQKPVLVCDCAGSVKTDKRVAPIFVGKYLVTGNKYEGKDPIYIYIKGDQRSLPPTNLEEVNVVKDDAKMAIYSNDPKWEKTLNTKVMKIVNSMKPNKELVDIAISIQPGTTYIALGYDDPLMVIPLDRPFNQEPVKGYKKDVLKACQLAKELD